MLKPRTRIKPYTAPEVTGWAKVWQKVVSGMNINSALVLLATGIFGYLGIDMKGTQEKGVNQDKSWHAKADMRWNRVDSALITHSQDLGSIKITLDSLLHKK